MAFSCLLIMAGPALSRSLHAPHLHEQQATILEAATVTSSPKCV